VASVDTPLERSLMLDGFLITNRDTILARARARVSSRFPKPSDEELVNGLPMFLGQLGDALRLAKLGDVIDHEEIRKSAGKHGRDLLRMGLTIRQVVHDYGDVCQVITELAVQQKASLAGDEFQTLNLCLDDAIAAAVTEYVREREREIQERGTARVGALARELGNLVDGAMASFEIIKSGRVPAAGSTGLVHSRSLRGLRDLLDLSLAGVRLDAKVKRVERISVSELVQEVELGALLEARERRLELVVTPVDREVVIEGDRAVLAAAISILLHNAFKFTREHGRVCLTTRTTPDRVLFEVADECGGLPPVKLEDLFRPFERRENNHLGVGLGLSICRKAARASAGALRVRDLPGKGCVFVLDLPRIAPRASVNTEAGGS
jgi:signal transduction histidine kinase